MHRRWWKIRFNVLKNVMRSSLLSASPEQIPVGYSVVDREIIVDLDAQRCYEQAMELVERSQKNGWYGFKLVLGVYEYERICAYLSWKNGVDHFVYIDQIYGTKIVVVSGECIRLMFDDPKSVIAFEHFGGGPVL